MPPAIERPQDLPPGYERSDAEARYLMIFAGGLVALVLVAMLAMYLVFAYLEEGFMASDPAPSPLAAELPEDPPDPRLQAQPAADLRQIRADEQRRLNSYGWVEPNAGVVRIPIERAMELLLQRGLPAREEVKRQK